MYKAKNGFILHDSTTPAGFDIKTPQDILTALVCYPAFETVAAAFIWEALEQAIKERKEYANIDQLAEFLTETYI